MRTMALLGLCVLLWLGGCADLAAITRDNRINSTTFEVGVIVPMTANGLFGPARWYVKYSVRCLERSNDDYCEPMGARSGVPMAELMRLVSSHAVFVRASYIADDDGKLSVYQEANGRTLYGLWQPRVGASYTVAYSKIFFDSGKNFLYHSVALQLRFLCKYTEQEVNAYFAQIFFNATGELPETPSSCL